MSQQQPKTKFVLAEATLDEINKQLKINTFVTIVLVLMLLLNTAQFIKGYSVLYGVLIAVMAFFLFIMVKSRILLTMQKQRLSK
ncbi:hypothetical protein [Psychrobacter celer]|uniref:hypothetical protein n=1 Tax=Psychrobacter celer TaxID=306572 RepID=UPI0018DF1C6A|nr:hypothetical protein [Psychrobacter celer]